MISKLGELAHPVLECNLKVLCVEVFTSLFNDKDLLDAWLLNLTTFTSKCALLPTPKDSKSFVALMHVEPK